jgi:hypothetical protein
MNKKITLMNLKNIKVIENKNLEI